MRHFSKLLLAVMVAASFLHAPSAEAQVLQVRQTVFGMDCAPCAYGLEKRLEGIDGVDEATVSLNEGLATLELKEANRVKLGTIREAVRESGFSAEEATIRAAGMLKQENGRWMLELGNGERFLLQKAAGSERAYERLETGAATITGRVAKSEEDARGNYELQLISSSSA